MNRIQDNITCRTPSYNAEPLINGLFAALCINIRVRCLQKLAIKSDALHVFINGLCGALHHFGRTVHHVNNFSLYSVIHCFKLFNEPLVFAVCVHLFFKRGHFFFFFSPPSNEKP
nr:MAG TPA: hypothetical protein [Caudoviricetes sp.]